MKLLSFLVSVVLIAAYSVSLDAEIMKKDLFEADDGLLTYDVNNQREWLDLPYSFDDLSKIVSRMGRGELLDGFKFATLEDVEQLMTSAGVAQVESFSLPGVTGPGPKQLIDSLGFIYHEEGGVLEEYQFTLGQVATAFVGNAPVFDDVNIVVFSVGSGTIPPGVNPELITGTSGGFFSSAPVELPFGTIVGAGDHGPYWLYRNAIPEPTSLSLVFIVSFAALLHRIA